VHTCIIEKLPYLVSLIMKWASPLNSYQKIDCIYQNGGQRQEWCGISLTLRVIVLIF
jgi:hypothetical protein